MTVKSNEYVVKKWNVAQSLYTGDSYFCLYTDDS